MYVGYVDEYTISPPREVVSGWYVIGERLELCAGPYDDRETATARLPEHTLPEGEEIAPGLVEGALVASLEQMRSY